jgi:hypothetical protein
MWTWLSAPACARPQSRKSNPPVRRKPRPLGAVEQLEAREVPAVTIQIDYSFDAAGFFKDPARRAVLQAVANDIGSHLNASLAPLASTDGNTWSASFFNPATGQQVTVPNLSVAADTIVVYAGGRAMPGTESGVGGNGGYSATGSQAFLNALKSRNPGGYSIWGGSVAFDTTTSWFFGTSTSGLTSSRTDFYSVASHELGHVLGIGTAPTWFSLVSNGAFTGANAERVYGGPVPVAAGGSHWAEGLTVGGRRAVMDPTLLQGTRSVFTALDYAALQDIGWTGGTQTPIAAPPPAVPPPASPPPVPTVKTVPLASPAAAPAISGAGPGKAAVDPEAVVITGPTDGSAQAFALAPDGTLAATGTRAVPFPGWAGVVRGVVADFNGDGNPDLAFGTGPGTAAEVVIYDGATGNVLVPPTRVLDGFSGGVYLAAGDVNRDGKAELAVSADAGGGTRVNVFQVAGTVLNPIADFYAFDDPTFRGGSRVAMGDVNRDGYADLIVGAGVGGGPRVAIYDGRSLPTGKPVSLIPDFFALDPSLRSGVFVAAGDMDGDGYCDVLYSTGDTGGPRVRVVSGQVLTDNPGKDAFSLPALADAYALDPTDRSGLRIAARDLNGDGRAELVVANGAETGGVVRVLTLPELQDPKGSTSPLYNPFGDPQTVDGFYVG